MRGRKAYNPVGIESTFLGQAGRIDRLLEPPPREPLLPGSAGSIYPQQHYQLVTRETRERPVTMEKRLKISTGRHIWLASGVAAAVLILAFLAKMFEKDSRAQISSNAPPSVATARLDQRGTSSIDEAIVEVREESSLVNRLEARPEEAPSILFLREYWGAGWSRILEEFLAGGGSLEEIEALDPSTLIPWEECRDDVADLVMETVGDSRSGIIKRTIDWDIQWDDVRVNPEGKDLDEEAKADISKNMERFDLTLRGLGEELSIELRTVLAAQLVANQNCFRSPLLGVRFVESPSSTDSWLASSVVHGGWVVVVQVLKKEYHWIDELYEQIAEVKAEKTVAVQMAIATY